MERDVSLKDLPGHSRSPQDLELHNFMAATVIDYITKQFLLVHEPQIRKILPLAGSLASMLTKKVILIYFNISFITVRY